MLLILSFVDYLVVNEIEVSFMVGSEVLLIDDVYFCVVKLYKMVRSNVIIILGEKGVVLFLDELIMYFLVVFCFEVIDIIGVGDLFIGGIVYCLVNNIFLIKVIFFVVEISMCLI